MAVTKVKIPIYTAADYLDEPRFSVLYVGAEGTAKTHNLLSWQGAGPMLILYFDPNTGTMQKFLSKDTLVMQPTIEEFRKHIFPAIKGRNLGALSDDPDTQALLNRVVTIGVDSVSFLAGANLEDTGKETFDDRGVFLDRMREWIREMAATTRPAPGKPSYNFICTVHEWIRTNEKGDIIEVSPKIEGQFRMELPTFFSTRLQCEATTKTVEVVRGPNDKSFERRAEYVVHTIARDGFRRAQDGVGGGRYKTLPPKLEGTYDNLMKHWGEE